MALRRLKMRFVWLSFAWALLLVGCSGGGSDLTLMVKHVADKECEAIRLRKARFELADRMRFLQDSIMLPSVPDSVKARLQTRVAAMDPEKVEVVSSSLKLASEISAHLDSLIQGPLKERALRLQFDSLLQAELESRSCL